MHFFILILVACSPSVEKEQAPAYLIDEAVFTQIIVDFSMSDALVESEMLPSNQQIYQKKMTYYQNILDSYQVEKTTFIQSYEYYAKDIDYLSAIYDTVLIELSKKEINLNQEE